MNCNAVMKKLQRAILSTGLVIKISLPANFTAKSRTDFYGYQRLFLPHDGCKHESGTK